MMLRSPHAALLSLAWAVSSVMAAIYSDDNPIQGKDLYVNPTFQMDLDRTLKASKGKVKDTLASMRDVSSAYWLDVKRKLKTNGKANDTVSMEGILKNAQSKSPVPLVTFIVYDLPNRDCHALASNGEICCAYNEDGTCDYLAEGDCAEGIEKYKTEYIDPLVKILKDYHEKVPIALVIEPDSLPNLASNLGNPRCGSTATQASYKAGVEYAVKQIAKNAPSVSMYVDAAHGGWLGWKQDLQTFLEDVQDMGLFPLIRGFALNTANYQTLGVQCPSIDWCLEGKNEDDLCCADPCKLITQYNSANNELNYALLISNISAKVDPTFTPKFVIDTGRNGVGDMRDSCSNWCNVRGAGVGVVPSTDTASELVDAYLWLKTPGESDGCTQILPGAKKAFCPRFDNMCASIDSIGSKDDEPRSPEAGKWFEYQALMLAENAHMEALPEQKSGARKKKRTAAGPKRPQIPKNDTAVTSANMKAKDGAKRHLRAMF